MLDIQVIKLLLLRRHPHTLRVCYKTLVSVLVDGAMGVLESMLPSFIFILPNEK